MKFPKIDNPGTKELRNFALISGSIVAVLFGLLLPWLFDYAWPIWPWIFTGVFWTWGLVAPDTLFVVYRIWLKFGHIAGWINTRIILGIMFYLIFFPVGLVLKALGKDSMAREIDSKSKSYRIVSEPMDKDHVERPY